MCFFNHLYKSHTDKQLLSLIDNMSCFNLPSIHVSALAATLAQLPVFTLMVAFMTDKYIHRHTHTHTFFLYLSVPGPRRHLFCQPSAQAEPGTSRGEPEPHVHLTDSIWMHDQFKYRENIQISLFLNFTVKRV